MEIIYLGLFVIVVIVTAILQGALPFELQQRLAKYIDNLIGWKR